MVEDNGKLGPQTLALQSGNYKHIVPPIDTSKTDPWETMMFPPPHTYSRTNPDLTAQALEKKISAMHDGAEAIVTGSGQGALVDILFSLREGGHLIVGKQMYGGTRKLVEEYLGRLVPFTLVDPRDPRQLDGAVRKNTRYLLIETPTNPLLDVVDLEQIQEFSQRRGIPYILDNTFATNQLLDGFRFGAHVVFYSTSKYFGGHHNAIGGAVVTRDKPLAQKIRENRRYLGHYSSPFSSYLIYIGVQTLPLRMREHSKNAQVIAEYLENHPLVSQVYYPGLPSHPGHEIAKRQMSGFGGMVSFRVNKSKIDPDKFAETVAGQKPPVIWTTESLGSMVSILAYPIAMSHRNMTEEQLQEIGVDDSLFRLSVGLENVEDIQRRLEDALEAAKGTSTK